MKNTIQNSSRSRILFILSVVLFTLAISTGCSKKSGRVAVVLDNSGSMASVGTAFNEIKQTVLNALMVVPSSYGKGLRVFDDSRSRLVAPYHTNLNKLRSKLRSVEPSGGTYIGESLEDAAKDLLERPSGDNRLIFITDGEGNISDIEKARGVRKSLDKLYEKGGRFKCQFILFSSRADPLRDTHIGEISEILGCDFTVADSYASAASLWTSLLRILGFDFYWILIIISALGYLILVLWSSYLVFDTQVAKRILARTARWHAITFLITMLPLVGLVHLLGLFTGLMKYVWVIILINLAVLVIVALGIGEFKKRRIRDDESDPFK